MCSERVLARILLKYPACLVLLVAGISTATGVTRERTNRPLTRTVIAGVKHREDSIASARGKFVIAVHSLKTGKQRRENWLWAFKDGKAREALMSGDWRRPMEIRVFDGQRCYYYDADANFVSSTGASKGMAAEEPRDAPREFLIAHLPSTIGPWLRLQFKYDPTGRVKPLSATLASKDTRFRGEESVDGLRCYRFEGKQHAGGGAGDLVTWWVTPERGFAVVKEERRMFDERGIRPGRRVTTARAFTRYPGGIWMPHLVELVSYAKEDPSGREAPVMVWTIKVMSLEVNVPLPDSLFSRPKYASGTHVLAPFDLGEYVVP